MLSRILRNNALKSTKFLRISTIIRHQKLFYSSTREFEKLNLELLEVGNSNQVIVNIQNQKEVSPHFAKQVLNKLLVNNDVENAIQLLEILKPQDGGSYLLTIAKLIHLKDLDKAKYVIDLMKNTLPKMDTVLFTAIIKTLYEHNYKDEIIEQAYDMERFGLLPNLVIATYLIRILVEKGRVQEAYNVYDQLKFANVGTNSLIANALVGGLLKIGQLDKCLIVFDDLLRDPRLHATQDMCCGILAALLKKEKVDVEKCVEVIKAMRKFRLLPNKEVFEAVKKANLKEDDRALIEQGIRVLMK